MPPHQQTQMRLLHNPHGYARRTPLRALLPTEILPLALATPRSPPARTARSQTLNNSTCAIPRLQ